MTPLLHSLYAFLRSAFIAAVQQKIRVLIVIICWCNATALHAQQAYFFDGGGSVSVPHTASLNVDTALTIQVWVNIAVTGDQRIIDKAIAGAGGGPFSIDTYQGRLRVFLNSTTQSFIINPIAAFPTNTWVNIAVTYSKSQGQMIVYQNAVEVGRVAMSGNLFQNTLPIKIGTPASGSALNGLLRGKVDEVRMYNRALTTCELSTNLNCELPPSNGLQLYFRFNEIAGSVFVPDLSGNNNHGSVTGTVLRDFTSPVAFGTVCNSYRNVLYVNAAATGGANNGSSWANAYTSLDQALRQTNTYGTACATPEIWIAKGKYYPERDALGNATPLDNRDKSFYVSKPVKLVGGFAGFETTAAQRVAGNTTVLSGDLGILSNNSDNAYHVIMSSANAWLQLDQLVVQDGSANGSASFVSVNGEDFAKNRGGGLLMKGGATITNTVFTNNAAGIGGAIFFDISSNSANAFRIQQSVFANNAATTGSAIYLLAGTNHLLSGVTISKNTGASTIYKELSSALTVHNSIVANNSGRAINTTTGTTASYSVLQEYTGGGTNVTNANVQFLNDTLPAGPDGEWLTADDGLIPVSCNSNDASDFSQHQTGDKDIVFNNRYVNLTYVPNTGAGGTPFIDLGAYENPFTADTSLFKGQIGNAHGVTNPRQRIPDSVSSISAGSIPAGVVPNIRWEKSIFPTSGFTAADSINNRPVYYLPAFSNTQYFRRVQSVCGIAYTSNVVEIKVLPGNGTLQGKVVIQNTVIGVDSVLITVQKVNDYPGSPQSRIDSAYTQVNGVFGFANLFYEGNTTTYIVKAKKGQNRISPDSIPLNLPANGQFLGEISFSDETALSISGRIFQQCTDCMGSAPGNPVLAPLDSVLIFKREPGRTDTTQITASGLLNGLYGAYIFSVQSTGRATVLPRYRQHRFSPYSREVQVTGPQNSNNDFVDTTTRLITGRFGAGCNDASIGTAEIEFADVLPSDANGQPRPSVFVKKVTTAIDGSYSIRLPARKYRVSSITFTPNANANYPAYARVTKDSVEQFFQRLLVSDSFQRDITDSNAVLNLTYHRPPQIVLEQFDDACSSNGFVLLQQLEEKSFKATVYEGNALLSCPAPAYSGKGADTLVMLTNVPFDDIEQSIRLQKDSARMYGISLIGGMPKTVGDYKKKWRLSYQDPFGRSAAVSRDVVVTGARSQGSTFQTVSPELPFMIVHDPPGSGSFATWQQDQARETTMRMFANSENSVNAWANVKIGTEFSAGLGYEVKTAIWGSVNAGVTTTQTVTSENESKITVSNSQVYSTSSAENAIGDGADVIIGGAVNFMYARALVLEAKNGCQLALDTQLIVSPKGFRTWYVYTQNFIEQNLIPRLQRNAALATADSTANRLLNEVKVWQQVLANNAANKAKAPFEDNRSFNGNTTQTWTSTISNSSSNTIEFNMSIDSDLAAELGLEIAGAGISGGVNVAFKMEQGKSTNNTFTKSTTTSYTLTDDDEFNFYSVDVKKDPLYNTPVFELKSGTSACPHVPGTQPRDGVFLEVDKTTQTNVPADSAAIFRFKLYNTSPSEESRNYRFNFNRTTNADAALIRINGSENDLLIPNLGYGDSASITVSIRRGDIANVYSFEGLTFTATDDCGGELNKSIVLAASFVSPCSSATLDLPENWLVNSEFNNNVPIRISGYNKAALNVIELQYSKVGASGWTNVFSLTPAQLSNEAAGTNTTWQIAGLSDTAYQVRVKVGCNAGVVYTPRVLGIIDRTAPAVFGRPQPSDDVFSRGDEISIRYTENISGIGLAQKIWLQRMDNLQYLPVQVSSFANAIMIIPQFNPDTMQGKEVRLIAQNIADAFGNTRSVVDTFRFVFAGGNNITPARLLSVSVSNATVQEFATTPIRVKFSLNNPDSVDTKVQYTLAGTASYNRDFTVGYFPDRKTSFPNGYAINNVQGTLVIPAGQDSAVLLIYPVNNEYNDSTRTVLVSAIATGDYGVTANPSVQASIINEDASRTFVFTGSGNFSNAANWQNQIVPPAVLQVNDHIFINPGNDGNCVLDIPLQVMPGGKVTIAPGKKLTVNGGVFIRK